MLGLLKNTKQHLMTGVSYMIPFCVAGGVLLALAVMISGKAAVPETGFLKHMSDIGIAGLTLFIPVLGGFIAYSMVDRPGIAPGMIGAYLANSKGGGFLGAIVAGLLAGIVVHYLKKIKVPKVMSSVMPIFIIPLVGTFVVGMLILLFIGEPIGAFMAALSSWLNGMQNSSKIILGIILGAMITFDMGGPLNKTAFFFAVAMIPTNPSLMAAVATAVCSFNDVCIRWVLFCCFLKFFFKNDIYFATTLIRKSGSNHGMYRDNGRSNSFCSSRPSKSSSINNGRRSCGFSNITFIRT